MYIKYEYLQGNDIEQYVKQTVNVLKIAILMVHINYHIYDSFKSTCY